jgi:hypothetical protein
MEMWCGSDIARNSVAQQILTRFEGWVFLMDLQVE